MITYNSFIDAIEKCNQGELKFNRGTVLSFLYNKKWYPVHTIVNEADPNDSNTYRSIEKISGLGVIIVLEEVVYKNHLPVDLTNDEIKTHVSSIVGLLNQLVN
jgi:hypothetical protein